MREREILPFTAVFQTVLVYLRPETMLLLTWNVNSSLYLLPSFKVNHKPLGFPFSGIGRTISDLSGDLIARLKILTSGSRLSAEAQRHKPLPSENMKTASGSSRMHSGRKVTLQSSVTINVKDTQTNS